MGIIGIISSFSFLHIDGLKLTAFTPNFLALISLLHTFFGDSRPQPRCFACMGEGYPFYGIKVGLKCHVSPDGVPQPCSIQRQDISRNIVRITFLMVNEHWV